MRERSTSSSRPARSSDAPPARTTTSAVELDALASTSGVDAELEAMKAQLGTGAEKPALGTSEPTETKQEGQA